MFCEVEPEFLNIDEMNVSIQSANNVRLEWMKPL
jgi:hypothetical protein